MIGTGELTSLQMATVMLAASVWCATAHVWRDGFSPSRDKLRRNDQARFEKQR